MSSALIPSIIRAYDDPVVRAYCWGRFWILRQRFLDEIGQYLPAQGRVLDLGCGFGLFSLYYAATRPGLQIEGFDLNPRRIEMARAAAGRLGLRNVHHEVGNVMDFRGGRQFAAEIADQVAVLHVAAKVRQPGHLRVKHEHVFIDVDGVALRRVISERRTRCDVCQFSTADIGIDQRNAPLHTRRQPPEGHGPRSDPDEDGPFQRGAAHGNDLITSPRSPR